MFMRVYIYIYACYIQDWGYMYYTHMYIYIYIYIDSTFDMQQYMSISLHVAIHHYLTYRCTFGSVHVKSATCSIW